MAIPSGAGTEVLKRVSATGDFNSAQTVLTVATTHIYTILNISICNNSSNDEVFYLFTEDSENSLRDIYLTRAVSLIGNATFVWDNKFVLNSADTIKLTTTDTSDLNVWVSFIDQDWT